MCQEECIKDWKASDGDAWSAYPWKEPTKSGTKVRVRENPHICKLEEKRRMADVSDAKLRWHRGQGCSEDQSGARGRGSVACTLPCDQPLLRQGRNVLDGVVEV